MGFNRERELKHCRWCGVPYWAAQPFNKDGFCIPAHKMALVRAYKKYVTRKSQMSAGSENQRVTPKKAKKKGKTHVKKTKEKS